MTRAGSVGRPRWREMRPTAASGASTAIPRNRSCRLNSWPGGRAAAGPVVAPAAIEACWRERIVDHPSWMQDMLMHSVMTLCTATRRRWLARR